MVLYGCALVAFTLFPFPDFAGDYCDAHANVSHWQLNPFQSFLDLADYTASNGLLATLTSNVLLQVVMNVVLFVPLGFFLAYRGRRSFGATVLIGLAISLSIELTQGTGLWGVAPCPYRLADVDDLLAVQHVGDGVVVAHGLLVSDGVLVGHGLLGRRRGHWGCS